MKKLPGLSIGYMDLASCDECRFFIRDKIGDGSGLGRCQLFDEYKAKNPSKRAIEKAFGLLGNKIFWGGHGRDRYCDKYEELL